VVLVPLGDFRPRAHLLRFRMNGIAHNAPLDNETVDDANRR
jgi:hypothetical protein